MQSCGASSSWPWLRALERRSRDAQSCRIDSVTVTAKRSFTNLADAEAPAGDLVGVAQSSSQGAITAGLRRRGLPTNMAIERDCRSGALMWTSTLGIRSNRCRIHRQGRLRQYTDGTGSGFDDCRLMAPAFFSFIDQFETTRKRSLSAVEDASSIIRNRSPSGVTS